MTGVILLNWNGINDTVECIESLLAANDTSIRIYIVDNFSSNDQAGTIAKKFPAVQVLAQSENLGFCEGNNVGISKAIEDGMEYVVLLNNDTLVPSGAISKLVEAFNKIEGAGAISPVILEHPATDQVWFADAKWISSRAQFNLNPDNKNYTDLKNVESWKSEFACGCCLLTSAKVLKEVGLLDGRYFAYYDEADWCKRLEKKGYHSYVTGTSFIYHKVSQTTPGLVATYLMTRNRILWMKENLSFGDRMKSFSYLTKEFFWHLLHTTGLLKGAYTKAQSRSFIRGWKDGKLGKFGKWNAAAEKIIFPNRNNK